MKILNQLHQLRTKQHKLSNEQEWIMARLKGADARRLLPKISIVGLHILTALLTGEQTGIMLADELGVTRGGVTRAAKKLVAMGLAVGHHRSTDKKKVYYYLTPTGQEIALQHRKMHEALNTQFAEEIGRRYNTDQLKLISQFLDDVQKLEDNLN